MEKYKKTLKIRIVLFEIVIILNLILSIGQRIMAKNGKIPADARSIADFQSGFTLALAIFSLFMLVKYRKLLKDERGLKESFHRENDERMILIRSKAGMPALLITSLTMIFGGIIGGYFNMVIFYTLLAAGACQMLLGICFKFYYLHKL